MPIVPRPALRGASSWDAVKTEQRRGRAGDVASASPGRRHGEIPPSIDAAPRASGQRNPKRPGDGGAPLPGIRTRRQELADRRGWSTFSKARPVLVAERRWWSAGRRVPPIARRNGAIVRRPTGRVSPTAHRRARTPSASAGAPLPSYGSAELDFGLRRTRRRSKNTGGGALALAGCLKSELRLRVSGAVVALIPPLQGEGGERQRAGWGLPSALTTTPPPAAFGGTLPRERGRDQKYVLRGRKRQRDALCGRSAPRLLSAPQGPI